MRSACVKLHVSLYPYIPDAARDGFEGLHAWLKKGFEAENPDGELVIKTSRPDSDLYAADDEFGGPVGRSLTEPVDGSGVHVAEIDASVFLSAFKEQGLLRAWSPSVETGDWLPAAREAVTLDGQIYGIPHWLCPHMLFSRRTGPISARDLTELRTELANKSSLYGLAGRIAGRWTLPMLYCSAHRALHGDVEIPFEGPLDEAVVDLLRSLYDMCRSDAGAFHSRSEVGSAKTETMRLFIENEADALIGYPESLHELRRALGSDRKIRFRTLPLGRAASSVYVSTDAFVLRRDCSPEHIRAAHAFVRYMLRPETMAWIMMSRDAGPGRIPRYLMPATGSAYSAYEVCRDPFYAELERIGRDAVPYPVSGFYEFARCVHAELATAVSAPSVSMLAERMPPSLERQPRPKPEKTQSAVGNDRKRGTAA